MKVEWGTEACLPDVRFVSLPVQSLSIANVLNRKKDIKDYSESMSDAGSIRYSFPNARVLVVDDLHTNLKVTEGLLAPYLVTVDSCLSGREAVRLVKQNEYDIVFLDQMMPEMDGIEAAAHIREWEKEQKNESGRRNVRIIALTANAVSGAHEMFIEKGFDDFLAKPIDISKLDETLNRWISEDKRERGFGKKEITEDVQLPFINGIDIQKGIRMTGGTEEGYRSVLSIFRIDAQKHLRFLLKAPEENDLSEFIINVHAIKSASASIGAAEISADAERLETAGRNRDMDFIHENLDKFVERLIALINELSFLVRH